MQRPAKPQVRVPAPKSRPEPHAAAHDPSRSPLRSTSRLAPAETFDEALHRQARNAPWLLCSIGVHAVVAGIFLMMPSPAAPPVETAQIITASNPEPVIELPEEPEVKPESRVESPEPDPTRDVDFVPGPPTEDPGREEDTEEDRLKGDESNFTDHPFDHPSTSAAIGVGGPPAGMFGYRGRGKRGTGGSGPTGGTPKAFEDGTAAALRWLRDHQSADGSWDADGFQHRCVGASCSGTGESAHDAGLTGLALLCFLGDGHTHQSGEHRDVVRRGLKWLRDRQDAEGCFASRASQQFQYDHAIAALAMCEGYGMTMSPLFKEPAQRSVDFIARSRNPYLAWRYGVRDGDNDTSVTGWMVMALKSAKAAGLEVDDGAFRDSVTWIDRMTEEEFGRVGYQARGAGPARTAAMQDRFPQGESEAMTAVGVLTRIFCGQDPDKEPLVGKGLALMTKKLPKWDADAGTIDFYYWYYGTLAAYQAGGDAWKQWSAAMKPSIVDHQRLEKGQCTYGSWDPEDPWCPEGGRIYATAINCLSLEVYDRYPRVFGVRR
ncbi:MAG: hypothetical protein HMLKMBBP_00786 [Planctomycetes bacterium]|nr:hypothetical protein [Planctomycetota bacterium]